MSNKIRNREMWFLFVYFQNRLWLLGIFVRFLDQPHHLSNSNTKVAKYKNNKRLKQYKKSANGEFASIIFKFQYFHIQ